MIYHLLQQVARRTAWLGSAATRRVAWALSLVLCSGWVAPTYAIDNGFTDASEPKLQLWYRVALRDPPAQDWKPRENGGILPSPSGTILYVPAANGLHAVEMATGKVLWSLATSERIDSTPVIAGTRIYAVTSAGKVYALDARTGLAQWKQPTLLEAAAQGPLAADAHHVYAVADPGAVIALDLKTGVTAWTYRTEVQRDFLLAGQGGALTHDNTVYVGTPTGKLVALAARDGGLTWEVALDRPARSPYADVDLTPVWVPRPAGAWLLASSHSGGLSAVQAADGLKVWTYDFQALGEPVVDKGRVYVAGAEGSLHIVDLATGHRLLARKLPGVCSGQIALFPSKDLILLPSEAGLDLISMTSLLPWSRQLTETGFASAPLVGQNTAFAMSNGGVLYAFGIH